MVRKAKFVSDDSSGMYENQLNMYAALFSHLYSAIKLGVYCTSLWHLYSESSSRVCALMLN